MDAYGEKLPEVREIVTRDGLHASEVLRLAASIDRMSAHVLGESLVLAATDAGLELTMPDDVHEEPGRGIHGSVEGHRVLVGSRAFIRALRSRRGFLCPPRLSRSYKPRSRGSA
jgi:cation transport ATPase